jgi:hypothetical protein
MESFKEFITESGPRIKRVRIRIRNGKIQRNIKVSNVKGFKLTGGRLVRMSSMERLHRRRGARKGKVKRRSKMARTLMKRSRSIRRRHSMGL